MDACQHHKDHSHHHAHGCGHAAVPHGSRFDYWARGHRHHSHEGHCDDHGKLPSTK